MASVSEILLEQARQAGEARRQRGALIGQSVAQIGQIPGQIIQGREDEQRRNTALALQQQEATRKALADKATEARDTERLGLERESASQRQQQYQNEQDAKNHETAVNEAWRIKDAPQAVIDDWARTRLPRLLPTNMGPDEASDLTERLSTPEGRKAIVAGLVATAPQQKPTYRNVNPGDVVIDDNNPQAGPVFTNPKPEPVKPEPKTYPVVVRGPNGRPVRKLVTEAELQQGVEEYEKPDSSAGDTTALTPQGLDVAALMYRTTGTMPALGMGDKTTRQRIINRAAELTQDDTARIGAGTNIAANKASFGADSDALKKLTSQRAAITAFEQTAQKNIDLFLAQAGKVVDTGSPLANRAVRAVSGQLLGSPDQAAYDAARQVAVNEIAKITSNPGLSGTLSDSARHEVDAFNPSSATLKQTVAVLRLLKQDMGNRTKSLDDEIGAIQGRLRGGSAPAGGPTVGETRSFNGKIGKWDGKGWVPQ